VATKPTTPVLVVPTNPLVEISDLLNRLPLQACVELNRRLLTSISYLPTGTGGPRAVLKTHSLRGRIWQHALGEQYGVKPCASPAGMLTECGAEISRWSTFSANTVSIFFS